MKPTASLDLSALFIGIFLLGTDALARMAQPQETEKARPSAISDPARPTSSNRWESLPRMTAYRCLAEAIGTASDPNTGAPIRASVDPQTGKPICRPEQPSNQKEPTL